MKRTVVRLVQRSLDRQADLLLDGVHLDDFDPGFLIDREVISGVFDPVLGHLGNVNQSFDALEQFDERAELGQSDDLTGQDVADAVTPEKVFEDVGLQLLDPQRKALIV